MPGKRWVCPNCGRDFAKANQWHSCEVRGVDSHFTGKKAPMKALFSTLIERLKRTGPLRVDAVKSGINFASKHHFGGVRVRDGYLRVGFLARQPIRSRRILETLVLGPNRVAHSVIIRSKEEIDRELLGWLEAARSLQS